MSITRKTVSRENIESKSVDTKRTSSTINFDEIEKKRQAGEANKKAEEEQRKKEIEQKTLVTRRKAKQMMHLFRDQLPRKWFQRQKEM